MFTLSVSELHVIGATVGAQHPGSAVMGEGKRQGQGELAFDPTRCKVCRRNPERGTGGECRWVRKVDGSWIVRSTTDGTYNLVFIRAVGSHRKKSLAMRASTGLITPGGDSGSSRGGTAGSDIRGLGDPSHAPRWLQVGGKHTSGIGPLPWGGGARSMALFPPPLS